MKRIIALIVSIFVAAESVCLGVAASNLPEDFTLYDLRGVGVPLYQASRTYAAPKADGMIESNEYAVANQAESGKGLWILSDTGTMDNTEVYLQQNGTLGKIKQETFVSFDGTYLYTAFRLNIPDKSRYQPIQNAAFGSCHTVQLFFGFHDGQNPAKRCSGLQNVYYFSANDLSCVGVTGTRIVRDETGNTTKSLYISSNSPYKGYTASDGTLWNGTEYRRHAALAVAENGNGVTVVFEGKILVEDALYGISEKQYKSILSSLKTGEGAVYASFNAMASLEKNGRNALCTSLGFSGNTPCPYSGDKENWNRALLSAYPEMQEDVYLPDYIPVPLYFNVPVPPATSQQIISDAKPTLPQSSIETDNNAQVDEGASWSVEKQDGSASVGVTTGEFDLDEDETVFDALPDADEMLPENTEKLELDEEDREKDDNGLLGKWLILLSGLLLLLSTCFSIVALNRRDKRIEKQALKKQKPRRKGASK